LPNGHCCCCCCCRHRLQGDLGDVLMMSLSMAVLIYFSMQLYRLYAYAYFHAGSYQTMMDMMQ
jgi:hypothetical protein